MISGKIVFYSLGLLDEQIRLQVIQQGKDNPEYGIQERKS